MIPALEGSQDRGPLRYRQLLEFLIPFVCFYLNEYLSHIGCTGFSKIPFYGITSRYCCLNLCLLHHYELASWNHEHPSNKAINKSLTIAELYLVLPMVVPEIFFLSTFIYH